MHIPLPHDDGFASNGSDSEVLNLSSMSSDDIEMDMDFDFDEPSLLTNLEEEPCYIDLDVDVDHDVDLDDVLNRVDENQSMDLTQTSTSEDGSEIDDEFSDQVI